MGWWPVPSRVEVKDFKGYQDKRADMLKIRAIATWRGILDPERSGPRGIDGVALMNAQQALVRHVAKELNGARVFLVNSAVDIIGVDVRLTLSLHSVGDDVLPLSAVDEINQPIGQPMIKPVAPVRTEEQVAAAVTRARTPRRKAKS